MYFNRSLRILLQRKDWAAAGVYLCFAETISGETDVSEGVSLNDVTEEHDRRVCQSSNIIDCLMAMCVGDSGSCKVFVDHVRESAVLDEALGTSLADLLVLVDPGSQQVEDLKSALDSLGKRSCALKTFMAKSPLAAQLVANAEQVRVSKLSDQGVLTDLASLIEKSPCDFVMADLHQVP